MWENFTKDTVISERGCVLKGVVLTPEDGESGRCVLYDGLNTNGRKIVTFHYGETRTESHFFPCGIRCEDGLYLNIIERTLEVLVVWEGMDGV